MKFNKIAFGVLVALITVQGVHAARFTVYNKSSSNVTVNPRWKGRADTFDVIQAGSSRTYDSGLNYVTGIKWEGPRVSGNITLNVDPLNLGGNFTILDSEAGIYSYDFGIAGKKKSEVSCSSGSVMVTDFSISCAGNK